MRGEGRVFQRGHKRWYIAYYAPGPDGNREVREVGGDTPQQARKLLRARLRELAVHRAGLRTFKGPDQERVMFSEILDLLERRYEIEQRKSLVQLRSRLKRIKVAFSLDRALAVTTSRLLAYVQQRQKDGAATASVNRDLETIRRAFAVAVESGVLSVAPRVPHLREDNARQGFLERGEFEAILKHLGDDDLRDFVAWCYWCGMRPGEVRSLQWSSFDRETWTLRLHARDAKTGYGRVLALEGPLRAVIERRLKARRLDCPMVFHRGGTPLGEFRKTWTRACREAGLAGKLIYDLRRTAVRNMVRAGVPERVAMTISGHRTRAVFDRYNIVNEDDIRAAVQKTSAYVDGLPTEHTVVPLPGIKRTAE
jgi:integrase